MLVPLLPFAMLPVAGLLARGGKWVARVALILAIAGGVLMLLFVGVGGRIPQYYLDPLMQVVVPIWTGKTPEDWPGDPFARTVFALMPGTLGSRLTTSRGWIFAPLVVGQIAAIALMSWRLRDQR